MVNVKNSLVTIIVPVYNIEKYLRRCLDSIVNQTYTNLEIILVDDGSTDSSGSICDEYGRFDKRVKVIHKINGGISSARNAALEVTRYVGYIFFVDSDDYIDHRAIEILVEYMECHNCDMVVFNFYAFDDGKKLLINTTGDCNYSTVEIKHRLILDYWLNSVWDKFYLASVYKNIRFPEGKAFEDAYVMPEVLKQCKEIRCISNALYFYNRSNGSSITKSIKVKNVFDIYQSWKNRLSYRKDMTESEYNYCYNKSIEIGTCAYYLDFKEPYLPVAEKKKLAKHLGINYSKTFIDYFKGSVLFYKLVIKKFLSSNFYLWVFWKRRAINR